MEPYEDNIDKFYYGQLSIIPSFIDPIINTLKPHLMPPDRWIFPLKPYEHLFEEENYKNLNESGIRKYLFIKIMKNISEYMDGFAGVYEFKQFVDLFPEATKYRKYLHKVIMKKVFREFKDKNKKNKLIKKLIIKKLEHYFKNKNK